MQPETDDEQGREGPVQRVLATTRATTRAVADAVVGAARAAVPAHEADPHRWQVVTVLRDGDDVLPGGVPPQPLADLGDAVEVRTRPAPGDRGTELAVRARRRPRRARHAAELDGRIREALRHSRSLLETGDILLPDAPGTTHRTLRGLPLEMAVRRARTGGRL